MQAFILYGSDGCHLCDVAEQILVMTLNPDRHSVDAVDIAYDDALMERFATEIPVLENESGELLKWPFDAEMLRAFIGE